MNFQARIRRTLERYSRGRAHKRRLPDSHGCRPIWVSPDARLRFWRRGSEAFDSELLSYVTRYVRPGDVIWDVGANVGEFSLAAANIVGGNGNVLAFEPDLKLAALIQRTLAEKENLDVNLQLICAAISDKAGISEFRIAERGRAANSLRSVRPSTQMGGIREVVTVPTLTLDSVLEGTGAPDLVKIDVEGAEWLVLQGSTNLLNRVRPVLIIEISDHVSQISGMLMAAGYTLFDANEGKRGGEITECVFNTLAIPD